MSEMSRVFEVHRQDDGTFTVHLPHQCDGWDIAGESFGSGHGIGVPQATAVEGLREFLADGQRALEALEKGETYE
jgi:hypothetical protein